MKLKKKQASGINEWNIKKVTLIGKVLARVRRKNHQKSTQQARTRGNAKKEARKNQIGGRISIQVGAGETILTIHIQTTCRAMSTITCTPPRLVKIVCSSFDASLSTCALVVKYLGSCCLCKTNNLWSSKNIQTREMVQSCSKVSIFLAGHLMHACIGMDSV